MRKNSVDQKTLRIYENKLKDYDVSPDHRIGIYGTGLGAQIIFEILSNWGLSETVKAVIDNDNAVESGISFNDRVVESLDNSLIKIDTIIVASMNYHETVRKRIEDCVRSSGHKIRILNPFGHNTSEECAEYVNYIEKTRSYKNSEEFVECDDSGISLNEEDTKVIAWYLPQYHRIDVNDIYYGRGFTEWTNTSTSIPMFVGHYQPHIPYDVGYYDLNNPEVIYRQVELAKHYGVFGFSYYYYWFSGKRIMDKPLEFFLNNPDIDIPFCITWANENWSALWDGNDNELIFEQKLRESDDSEFIRDLIPYFLDRRYLKIDNRFVLIVYRLNIWKRDRVVRLFENFRREMARHGLGDLYIIVCNSRGFEEDVKEWGADALVEFPPHGITEFMPPIRIDGYLNPDFLGEIRDGSRFIEQKRYYAEHSSEVFFRGALPYWDSSARKAYSGARVLANLTPEKFETWMTDIIIESKRIHSKDENYVFVNAWNEWAEGAHLEPDLRYGYANLAAVKRAIEKSRTIS